MDNHETNLPDPDELDDLLDEIEENERKDEERRKSESAGNGKVIVPDDKMEDNDNNNDHNETRRGDPDLVNWIRNLWRVGSKLEVYSASSKKWLNGTIKRILTDNEGEWLEIQYINSLNQKRSKETPRDDRDAVRPLNKAMLIYKYVFNAIQAPSNIIGSNGHLNGDLSPNAAINNVENAETSSFGQSQSPIDIVTAPKSANTHKRMSEDEFHSNPLHFNYPETVKNCTILNNGHTVQISIDESNECELLIYSKIYKLKQFHFHTPSEHTIDGKRNEMELHLVHLNEENEIAVLAFIFTTKQKHFIPKLELSKSRAHLILSSSDDKSSVNKIKNNKSMVIMSKPESSLKIMHESEEDEDDDDDTGTDDEWDDKNDKNDKNDIHDIHDKNDKNDKNNDDKKTQKIKKENEGNDFLAQFWDQLPLEKTKNDIKLKNDISFDYLFETASNNFSKTVKTNEIDIDMQIFEYMGSLTTPPYTEGVQWLVSKKTHFINNKQLHKLSSCWNHENNARETQDYFGRTVSLRSKNSLRVVT